MCLFCCAHNESFLHEKCPSMQHVWEEIHAGTFLQNTVKSTCLGLQISCILCTWTIMQAMLGVLEKSEHELGMEGDVATLQPIQEQPAGSEKGGQNKPFFSVLYRL